MPSNLLRLPSVVSKTGLAKSTIYARITEGTFPAPIKLGPNTVAWQESEIEDWIQDCIEASRPAAESH